MGNVVENGNIESSNTEPDSSPIEIDIDLEGPDPQLAKLELRSEVAQTISAMSKQERQSKSEQILTRLLNMAELKSAKQIMSFSPLSDEPDIFPLVNELLQNGREVLLPITNPDSLTMSVASITDPVRDLKVGAYGILEPANCIPLSSFEHLDVVIIPGRAFDSSGNRLGRGKGYYDNFLSQLKPHAYNGPLRVGVAYEAQIFSLVPTTPRDASVDIIITESRVINCRS